MARVVDRLLAQLPGLRSEPVPHWGSSNPFPAVVGGTSTIESFEEAPTHSDLIGAWARVLLGLALGVMMARWPYPRNCGGPLAGYLGALVVVILAGGWAAVAAWRTRTGLAHIVSLILVLYGLILVMAELLPRSGYSVDRATWQCADVTVASAPTSRPSPDPTALYVEGLPLRPATRTNPTFAS
jgi:hypothetical protein